MAYVIVATIYLLGVWLLLYCFLPWVGKLTAIYILHDARDRIFDAAHKCEPLASTNIYRDAEYICTVSLHVVRERSYGAAVAIGSDWAQHHDKNSHHGKHPEYRLECEKVCQDANGLESLRALVESVRASQNAVVYRVLSGNPVALLVGLTALVLSVTSTVLSLLSKFSSRHEDGIPEDSVVTQTSQQICIPTVRPYMDDDHLDAGSGIRTAFKIARHAGPFQPLHHAA